MKHAVRWLSAVMERQLGGLSEKGKSLSSFYREVVKHPLFYFPFLSLSIMAYLPSIANTKRQFEDFHMEFYLGEHGAMKTARWWMYLQGRSFQLPGNDIANKYLAFLFLLLGALMITAVFYCLSGKKGVFKYTVLAATIVVFPLINEIWSYNGANLMACQNFLLCGWAVYYLLCVRGHGVKKLVLASIPFVLISSSYESGLFLYITLVFGVLFCLCVTGKLKPARYFSVGAVLAVPLFVGTAAGMFIGRCISRIAALPYIRYGDTESHWHSGIRSAVSNLFFGTLDRYVLRSLVYVPIAVFVLASALLLIVLVKAVADKKGLTAFSGAAFFLSLFLLPVLQGSPLTYRAAQNVTVFTAVVFFLLLEKCGEYRKLPQKCFAALMTLVCLMESAFLLKTNLVDYQSAHNDEDLVRQMGYQLTAHYSGKPVIFVGHIYEAAELPSKLLQKQITVDGASWNGRLYSRLRERIIGHPGDGMKFHETNLWSVLYLVSREAESMEQFFDYCGYDIDVIPYWDRPEQYPEVGELLARDEMHVYELTDMGEYVVIRI